MAGHGSSGIVQYNKGHLCLIVDGVYDAGDGGGEECGVSHECKAGGIRLYMPYALCDAKPCAHAKASVYHVERHGVPKSVASDVAAENSLPAFHGSFDRVERRAVRAACTEDRRSDWEGGLFIGRVGKRAVRRYIIRSRVAV